MREVYEIKPATHTGHYGKKADQIPWIYTWGNPNYVPGWMQRQGYIDAIGRDKVDEKGNSLGNFINMNKPFLELGTFMDVKFYASYFSIPAHPGMIYYKVYAEIENKRVLLKKRAKKAKENNKTDSCEIIPMPLREKKPVAAIQRVTEFSILTSLMSEIIGRGKRAYQNIFFLPMNPEFIKNPIDRESIVN